MIHSEADLVNRKRLISGEVATPFGDWVLARAIDHEERTAGGIILPDAEGDYDNLKQDKYQKQHTPDREIRRNDPQQLMRCQVIAVGPGQSIDVASDHSGEIFARKPMAAKDGAVVLVQKRNCLQVSVGGEVLAAFHDYAVLATLHSEGGNELLDPEHDYIFAKPAASDAMQVSPGGIAMPDLQDPTGVRTALPDRWEALGVGQGAWALRYERGKAPAFERRPAPVGVGDQFLFEGQGMFTSLFGAPMLIIQAFQVAFGLRPVAMGSA